MSIRIITGPKVYAIGRQVVDIEGLCQFLADNGSPHWETDAPSAGEAIVEVAGRACYNSFVNPRPGGNAAYVGHILGVAHGSVLEHAVLTILIDGISRTLSHELVRHRQGIGISQESQRYVDVSDCAFVVPPALMGEVAAADKLFRDGWGNPEYNADECDCLLGDDPGSAETAGIFWFRSLWEALVAYRNLSDYLFSRLIHISDRTARRKAAREASRSVLPGCAATRIVLTLNARAARWLVELRGSLAADAEFARLAVVLCRTFKAEWPNLVADMAIETDASGREYVACRHHKV